jgi:nitrite reductase (NADH) small subunit
MNARTELWQPVCRLDELPRQGARRWLGADEPIAVFRTLDDKVFALVDRCPHRGGPLSQGMVLGDQVACPLHNWTIELSTGQACGPDEGCARRYPVRVDEDGRVLIDLGSRS